MDSGRYITEMFTNITFFSIFPLPIIKIALNVLDEFCRNTCNHGVGRYIFSDHCTCAYHGIVADMYAWENPCASTNPKITCLRISKIIKV
jgi:hypothetical protein